MEQMNWVTSTLTVVYLSQIFKVVETKQNQHMKHGFHGRQVLHTNKQIYRIFIFIVKMTLPPYTVDACYRLALYMDANNAILSNKHHEIFIRQSGGRHECSFQPVIYFVSRQMLLSMKGCLQPLMIPVFYWGNDKLQNKSDLSVPNQLLRCFSVCSRLHGEKCPLCDERTLWCRNKL